jgi:hypothetical protein
MFSVRKTDINDPLGLTGVRVTIVLVIVLTFLFSQISTCFFTQSMHMSLEKGCISKICLDN